MKRRHPKSLKSLFILIVIFEKNEQLREARVGGDITMTVLQSIFFKLSLCTFCLFQMYTYMISSLYVI